MLCEICGKNEATVHLTEIIDGNVIELHICESCAQKKGEEMEKQFGLAELLAGLVDMGGIDPAEGKTALKLRCSSCGMTYADFKKIGRLGCAQCYHDFRKALLPLIKRIQGTGHHTGKVPSGATPAPTGVVSPSPVVRTAKEDDPLKELKKKLRELVQREEFEEAARVRDQIKALEKGKTPKKKSGKKNETATGE
jgi:protein arginine kinase activator